MVGFDMVSNRGWIRQIFELVTGVLNWCKRILTVWFVLSWWPRRLTDVKIQELTSRALAACRWIMDDWPTRRRLRQRVDQGSSAGLCSFLWPTSCSFFSSVFLVFVSFRFCFVLFSGWGGGGGGGVFCFLSLSSTISICQCTCVRAYVHACVHACVCSVCSCVHRSFWLSFCPSMCLCLSSVCLCIFNPPPSPTTPFLSASACLNTRTRNCCNLLFVRKQTHTYPSLTACCIIQVLEIKTDSTSCDLPDL